jgi:hypothetical protein
MVSFDLWAGRAVTTTLSPKFGSPAQIWDMAGLGKEGAGWNPEPGCVGGGGGGVGARAPLFPPSFLPPSLLALGRGRPRAGRHLPWWQGRARGLTGHPAYPPKLLLKLRYFSISFGDFSFFGEFFFTSN